MRNTQKSPQTKHHFRRRCKACGNGCQAPDDDAPLRHRRVREPVSNDAAERRPKRVNPKEYGSRQPQLGIRKSKIVLQNWEYRIDGLATGVGQKERQPGDSEE